MSISTWTEDMKNLFDYICQTRVSPNTADILQRQLQINKQKFLHLLDYPVKNSNHRNTLKNSKKTYINRITHNVNDDFIEKTLFISDQLNIDEYVASTLLMYGVNKGDYDHSIDTAVVLYYDERSYLLACIDVILKTVQDASVSEDIQEVCRQYMAEIMKEPFVEHLLDTLDNITKTIHAIITTGSVTGDTPLAGSGKLGDVNNIRIERLVDERIYIVQILYHLSSLFTFKHQSIIRIMTLLEQAELTDTATPYMIITMLSLLHDHTYESSFISCFHQHLMTHGSTVPVIKATIILQWILYLNQHQHSLDPNELKELLETSIKTDVFLFMDDYLVQQKDKIRHEFHRCIIYELEYMTNSMIRHLFSTIQQMKYQEEDSCYKDNQCHDLQHFFILLSDIYRNRLNAGNLFWNELNFFIRWMLDIKLDPTVAAAFNFLGSIATGEGAHSLFCLFQIGTETDLGSSTLFSWGKPMAALEFYGDLLRKEAESTIPVQEESILLNYLYCLQQTVQYSSEARIYFWEDRYKTILFNILGCPTSVNLRAALFDVLSAFCSPYGGGVSGIGAEISQQIWLILDQSDIGKHLYSEQKIQKMTETLSIIRLLASAIHTHNKREILINGYDSHQMASYDHKIISFISYVVDDVFVNTLEYTHPDHQWVLTEACLSVIENSVYSLHLDLLQNEQVKQSLQKAIEHNLNRESMEEFLLKYLVHPGFQILIRILSGGRVINELFDVIMKCHDQTDIYHKKCLVKTMRILDRVLDLQNIFCNILIPFIINFSKRKETSEFQLRGITFPPLPSVVLLGQLILFKTGMLTQIALLINYEDQEEVCYLSTRILHKLSVDSKVIEHPSKIFSYVSSSGPPHGMSTSLACLLNSSPSAESIIYGVSERLSMNFPEVMTCDDYEYDPNNIPFWLASDTLKNVYNYPSDKPQLEYSVRLAIMDALLANAMPDSPSPSLTEFLLGYNILKTDSLDKIQDTDTNKNRVICFHSLLDMLRQGIEHTPFMVDAMVEDQQETLPLIDTHPIMAEKCYELIYRLCAKKTLSTSTMRYLRNRENFFYKQFDAMSARLEHHIEDSSSVFGGVMVCADGTRIPTDFFRLRSKLHQRAWFLQSLALELHSIATQGQKNQANKLLGLLYGGTVSSQDEMDQDHFLSDHRYEQPLIKILELISSLEFNWEDNLLKEVHTLHFFSQFDPQVYLTINERQCEVFDIRRMYTELRRQQLKMEGDGCAVEEEIGFILEWAMADNHRREIKHGKIHCLRAWKQVIHVTLLECFDMLASDMRERITFKLLTMLLSKVVHTVDMDLDLLKGMSEIILALMNRLRKDKEVRPASHLPMEDLKIILAGIIDCIRVVRTDMGVRGDLYAAITSFVLYIKGHERDQSYKELEKYVVEQIVSNDHSLLHKICTDAMDGLAIWKTTAFTALDSLNTLSLQAGNPVVQPFLISKNYLQYFIDMIRSDDAALSNILEQIDAPLLPLYIHESKMSILLTLAMNTEGANLLLRHQIFEILGQCQYMKAHQQDLTAIEMSIDSSSELTERAHQLLLPTLKLIVAILVTIGKKNNTVLLKAEGWVRRQQSALVSILKEEYTTLLSLEKLKWVTTIMYYISCRKGYSDDLIKRGINQLHNSILLLHFADDMPSKIIPYTNDEKAWNTTPDKDGSKSSVLETKGAKLIAAIQSNVSAYKAQSATIPIAHSK